MSKVKLDYEQPSCDILVVRLEERILSASPNYGPRGSAGGETNDEDYGDF